MRTVRYRQPVLEGGKVTWVEVEEFDVSRGIVDWADGDYFVAIVEAYLTAGHGREGQVGAARSYMFDAQELVRFGLTWMERTFGLPSEGR
jgi:aminoglycoside 3-N-acetyltransferase